MYQHALYICISSSNGSHRIELWAHQKNHLEERKRIGKYFAHEKYSWSWKNFMIMERFNGHNLVLHRELSNNCLSNLIISQLSSSCRPIVTHRRLKYWNFLTSDPLAWDEKLIRRQNPQCRETGLPLQQELPYHERRCLALSWKPEEPLEYRERLWLPRGRPTRIPVQRCRRPRPRCFDPRPRPRSLFGLPRLRIGRNIFTRLLNSDALLVTRIRMPWIELVKNNPYTTTSYPPTQTPNPAHLLLAMCLRLALGVVWCKSRPLSHGLSAKHPSSFFWGFHQLLHHWFSRFS